MRWYSRLYVGKRAKRRRYAIIQNIRHDKFQPDAYVITPASGGNNLFDIYPAAMLLFPGFRKEELFVLGIASGYFEALEVVRSMVDDLYQKTGGFDLETWLGE